MSSALLGNLLSPMILAFILGLGARMAKSDLKVPEPVYQVLSMYLLLAIGLKGGMELRGAAMADLWRPMLATVGFGLLAPPLVLFAARRFLKVEREDAASIAAHYGSVSVVTFIAAKAFMEGSDLKVAGVLTALVVLMEVPGIMVGLALGRGANKASGGILLASADLLRCKGVILLGGGLLIGRLASDSGIESVRPFFTMAFPGVLVLFLLEMGLLCGQRLREVLQLGWKLPVFGITLSLVLGTVGVLLATWAGMDTGTAAVFGAMAASASYIAAPAAVSHALPGANPALALGLALGVSFPFNLAFGIPLALEFSKWLH